MQLRPYRPDADGVSSDRDPALLSFLDRLVEYWLAAIHSDA